MRRTIIIMAVALLAIASISTPALADQPDGPVHVALGDSVAAGSGANHPDLTGYVPRLNRYLRSVDCVEGGPAACPQLELSDYSVGGATSDDLIADQLGAAVAEIVARQTDGNPDNNVEFITVTVGGNDLFQQVISACGAGVSQGCIDTITALFGNYGGNLVQILGTLRTVAPDAEIAIMTYYNPLGSCYLSDLAPLADLVLEGGGGLAFGLNDIIRNVASGVGGVTVVETYGLLADEDFVGEDDCLHPDDSGHRTIARAFRQAMA
jgi:lysophospholipase L1-like esterase